MPQGTGIVVQSKSRYMSSQPSGWVIRRSRGHREVPLPCRATLNYCFICSLPFLLPFPRDFYGRALLPDLTWPRSQQGHSQPPRTAPAHAHPLPTHEPRHTWGLIKPKTKTTKASEWTLGPGSRRWAADRSVLSVKCVS